MRKIVYLLLAILLPVTLCAHSIDGGDLDKRKRKRRKNSEIRYDRPFALSLDGGWNTIGANGLMASYYISPKFGLDAGVGTGIKGPKLGIRGKYMLSTENFAPFLGLGISATFSNVDEVSTIDDQTNEFVIYDVNNVLFFQPTIGFEFMTKGGFLLGFATGYSIAANSPVTILETNSTSFESEINLLWGNGIIASFNIGYAF